MADRQQGGLCRLLRCLEVRSYQRTHRAQYKPLTSMERLNLNLGTRNSDYGRVPRIHVYSEPQVTVLRSPFHRSLDDCQVFSSSFFFLLTFIFRVFFIKPCSSHKYATLPSESFHASVQKRKTKTQRKSEICVPDCQYFIIKIILLSSQFQRFRSMVLLWSLLW